jgi:hypothetical protein
LWQATYLLNLLQYVLLCAIEMQRTSEGPEKYITYSCWYITDDRVSIR